MPSWLQSLVTKQVVLSIPQSWKLVMGSWMNNPGGMVSDLLCQTNTHKSMGWQKSLPSCFQSFIYQHFRLTEEVPIDWKLANATPSYKKDWKDNPRNYRSVSLTSVPRKMMGEIKTVLPSLATRLNHRKHISVNCSLPIWIIELNLLICTIQEFPLTACLEMWNPWLCLVTKHFCIGFMKSLVFFPCRLHEHITCLLVLSHWSNSSASQRILLALDMYLIIRFLWNLPNLTEVCSTHYKSPLAFYFLIWNCKSLLAESQTEKESGSKLWNSHIAIENAHYKIQLIQIWAYTFLWFKIFCIAIILMQ